MHKHYVNYLKRFGYLSSAIEDSLIHRIRTKSIAKNSILLNPGEICRNLIFVNSGYFRIFSNSDEFKTIDIIGPDYYVYISESFLNQKPSEYGIECISDAEVISLSYYDWNALQHHCNDFTQLIFRLLLSEKDFYKQQLTITGKDVAKQRYLLLKKRYPQIDLSIRQNYIADLLNISAIHLSRIKKEVLFGR